MRYCGVALDHALSALIEDLEARGMERDVMVVVCGEMGRTPRINGRGDATTGEASPRCSCTGVACEGGR